MKVARPEGWATFRFQGESVAICLEESLNA